MIPPPTNNGNIHVETVTSESQVSPIEQSESVNYNHFVHQSNNDNNHQRFDWTGHREQGDRGRSNVRNSNIRNNSNNNSNYSTNNNTLLPSILSVNTSNIANNTGSLTGLPPLQWNLITSTANPNL